MSMNQIPETKAFELIGKQQLEIALLRERLGILQQHQCAVCVRECCKEPEQVAPE